MAMHDTTKPLIPVNRTRRASGWEPHVTLVEDHQGTYLEMLLPGVEHVETHLDPRSLTVRGSRHAGEVTREVPRQFEHRTFFGRPIDPAAATTHFGDGVLTVRVAARRHAHT